MLDSNGFSRSRSWIRRVCKRLSRETFEPVELTNVSGAYSRSFGPKEFTRASCLPDSSTLANTGYSHTTQRRKRKVPRDEPHLVLRMIKLGSRYGRYGYRRITAVLRRDGWRVNHKRIERLCVEKG